MQRLFLRNIVCAYASPGCATEAVQHAAGLAAVYEARLHLLRVRPRRWKRRRHEAKGDGAAWPAIPGARPVVVDGDLAAEAGAFARRHAADLVVIGHGRRNPDLVTIVGAVVRQAGCPVLAVPVGARPRHEPLRYQRIVCAVSSGLSTATLRCALAVAQEFQSQLTLVNVDSPAAWGRWLPGHAVLEDDLDRLRAHIPADAHAWCDIDEIVTQGEPAVEVAEAVARVQADLVVVGTTPISDTESSLGPLAIALLSKHAPVLVVPITWPARRTDDGADATLAHEAAMLTAS